MVQLEVNRSSHNRYGSRLFLNGTALVNLSYPITSQIITKMNIRNRSRGMVLHPYDRGSQRFQASIYYSFNLHWFFRANVLEGKRNKDKGF